MTPEAALQAFVLEAQGKIAVAVSGGADSLCALQLLHEIAPQRVQAVTVDHCLRPESGFEAQQVAAFCAARGISHQCLTWNERPKTGNISHLARQARYGLMAQWAAKSDVAHIVVAHSREDVAESLLMSLARAAGVDGLAQMRAMWQVGSVRFQRPLLQVARADLRAALVARGLTWIEDPSNRNLDYLRVRLREMLPSLQEAGVKPEAIATSARHLAAAADALDWVLARDFAEAGTAAGGMECDITQYRALPAALRHRFLVGICAWIAQGYSPRGPELQRLDGALMAGQARRVLGGVIFTAGAKRLRAAREFSAITPWDGRLFDGRWHVTGQWSQNAEIAPLGPQGLKFLPEGLPNGISRDAAIATPAVWCEGKLIAAPIFAFGTGVFATLAATLGKSLVSH